MQRRPHRRRRPALACVECRRRKIKCDRKDPCSHCVFSKSQCTFKTYNSDNSADSVSPRQFRQGLQSDALSSPSIVEPLLGASIIPAVPPISTRANSCIPSTTTSYAKNPQHSQHTQDHGAKENLQDLQRRILRLEELSASPKSSQGTVVFPGTVGLQESRITLNKTRTLRWSNVLGTAPELGTIYACKPQAIPAGGRVKEGLYQSVETQVLIDKMSDLLQQCKNIARSLKVGRPSRQLSGPSFSFVPPPREVADKMVTLYFRYFESTHRILHAPSFWTDYQRYWDHPETVTNDLRIEILLVIGIGSSLYDYGDMAENFRNMVHQWIFAAQAWLSGPLEKDRLNIPGIQVYCLTILARQIFSVGGDLVWMSMGSLLHRAMQIGLHRDPKYLPAMSVLQSEVRRRLWATILEMLAQSSLDSAMPARISFDDFDTNPPSNISDEDIDESTQKLYAKGRDTYTSSSVQLILLDALPARLRVLQLLNGLRTELSYTDVLALGAEISNAYRACSTFVKENDGIFHSNLVGYHLRRFLIPLHCSFAIQARSNPLFYYSLKSNLETAIAMIVPERNEQYSRLLTVSGGMFREGMRCAICVVCVELIAEVEAIALDETLHSNLQHKEMLKKTVQDLISFSTERIRLGETNIKGHMFLSMILAQVAAIEKGIKCDLNIAQAGVKSLEFCLGLLQARAAAAPPQNVNTTLLNLDDQEQAWDLDLGFDFFSPDFRLS